MVSFILNNETIRTEQGAGMTLLDFIREITQQKGTKIGCREGDCGACTVLVGILLEEGHIQYRSITSCISPLGNANGKHIVTVEGISLPQQLNVAQQALVDNSGTQCGFCTPGFAVSMTGAALNGASDYRAAMDAISGNICRCTGYKSIERAAFQLTEKLVNMDETSSISALIKQGFIPAYFQHIPTRLRSLNPTIISGAQTMVGGGTDLYVRHADRLADEAVYLLQQDDALSAINIENGICTLGAGVTVTEFVANETLQKHIPNLRQFIQLISSQQIRNMGTLAGNFVNASPIGDMSIFFLALDATLAIKTPTGVVRRIFLKDFFRDYKVYDLERADIIQSISFSLPESHTYFNFEKVSKRTHLDIASVNSAIQISVKDHHIEVAHVSTGGVSAIPKYLFKTSRFLRNKPINTDTVLAAAKILQAEISPISDVRGSADYKRLLAQRLFFAHFIELFPNIIHFEKLLQS